MSEQPNPERPQAPPPETEEEPKTMLAIIMGGIAALFIFSIVMAFNYASHSVDDRVAARKHAPASSAPAMPGAATTGSGGASSR